MNADPLRSPAARAVRHVAALSSGPALDPGLRVTLNFHPDRRTADGRAILDAMAEDGAYRSQFATGTSNGGLTAHPGGDRWLWESRIFGGVYDTADADERPVYGALDFRRKPLGAAPRFGSAFFRLSAAALARTTFCYPDSWLSPTAFGVATAMPLIGPAVADSASGRTDALDDYVEAQVHGPLLLAGDVEALVLDPCFRGTGVEAAARRLPCPLAWHQGVTLGVGELVRHREFRGPEIVDLGLRLAVDGRLDPRILGDAARSGGHDPQQLKKVWHLLARFGAPA
ncbi:DUF3626 domain-containing protein [Streptacidiphilus cavernicola]|uniref:DUF3626 domain-containing protein n=1 Tax=Streptacidiphilus cavernicola TaxID=3342716 RepID=A0ABV6VRT1_9ACTN